MEQLISANGHGLDRGVGRLLRSEMEVGGERERPDGTDTRSSHAAGTAELLDPV